MSLVVYIHFIVILASYGYHVAEWLCRKFYLTLKMNVMEEFLEEHEWHCGLVDENKKTVTVKGSFVYVEWAYFEGYNMPTKIIDGKAESFDIAHDRVSRWFKLPAAERLKLRKDQQENYK